MGTIYTFQNLENGMTYVGQTTVLFEKRLKHHLKTKKGKEFYLQNALKKYGLEAFNVTLKFWQDDKLNEIFDNGLDFYDYIIARIPALTDRDDAKELFTSWINGTGYLDVDKTSIRDIFSTANTFLRKYKTNNYKNVCVLNSVLAAEEETSETIRKLSIKQEFDIELNKLTQQSQKYGNNDLEFQRQYQIISLYRRLLNRNISENELIVRDNDKKTLEIVECEILNSDEYKKNNLNKITNKLKKL